MNAPDADAVAREAIAQTVLKFKWKESEPSLKEHQFNEEYRSTRWFQSDQVRRDFEEAQHMLYCRACMKTDERLNVRAIRLYVTTENDPLGNAPAICHLLCYNCGWEVYVNLPRDPRKAGQEEMAEGMRAVIERQRAQQVAAGAYGNINAKQQELQRVVARGIIDPATMKEHMRKAIEELYGYKT